MLYRQDISGCLLERIGALGLGAGELGALLERTRPSLDRLRGQHARRSETLLVIAERRDDLRELAPIAEEFRGLAHVIVLGIGGSSLGGQTLCALADRGYGPRPGSPRLHFMENIDPASFSALFAGIDLARTGVIVISKSGDTLEPLMQLAIVLEALSAVVGSKTAAERTLALTEPKDNALRRLAKRHAMRVIDCDPDIAGRFSVLSNVGVLPALIAGLDAEALRRGAAAALSETLSAKTARAAPAALGAAVSVGLAELHNLRSTVLMPYADGLALFGLWYRQLWAESLGKSGKGTTPIRALGAVDQHSQLQLYLDGPADKMFTLVVLDQAGKGGRVSEEFAAGPEFAYLAGRTMGDLLEAEQRATAETLMQKGRPTRVVWLERLDEERLGALLMHFMLETLIAADLFGVPAFGQPAVEQGKLLARRYLGEGRTDGAKSPA